MDELEEKPEEETMDTVKASASEIIAKPKDVKKFKSESKVLTQEEKDKLIEDNIIGEFYD